MVGRKLGHRNFWRVKKSNNILETRESGSPGRVRSEVCVQSTSGHGVKEFWKEQKTLTCSFQRKKMMTALSARHRERLYRWGDRACFGIETVY